MQRLALIAALCCSLAIPSAQAGDDPTYTLRWAQIHLPSSAADRAAFEFARQVEEETNGDIDVIVYARTEYEEVAGKRRNAMQIVKDVSPVSYTHLRAHET